MDIICVLVLSLKSVVNSVRVTEDVRPTRGD